jgi:DNA-binding Lrp family transcriptional regulator
MAGDPIIRRRSGVPLPTVGRGAPGPTRMEAEHKTMARYSGIRDDLDRRLIALLQSDARQSTMTLAKRLGVARSTVHERLRRLEREGVIKGYSVRLGRDPFHDYTQALALISLAQRQQRSVVERLSKMPEVRVCMTISGECDLFLIVETPRLEDLDAVIDEITSGPGVERCRSYVVLAKKFDWRADDPVPTLAIGKAAQ